MAPRMARHRAARPAGIELHPISGIVERNLLTDTIAGIPLQKLRASHIETYYAGATVSASTLTLHHAILHRALRKAVKDGSSSPNPATDLDGKPQTHAGDTEEPAARLDRHRGAGVPGRGSASGGAAGGVLCPGTRQRGAEGRAVRAAVGQPRPRHRQDAHRAAAPDAGARADVWSAENRAPAHRRHSAQRRSIGCASTGSTRPKSRWRTGRTTPISGSCLRRNGPTTDAVGDVGATAPGEQPRAAGVCNSHQDSRREADQVPRAAAYVRHAVAAGGGTRSRCQRTARTREGEHDAGGLRARPAGHAAAGRRDSRRAAPRRRALTATASWLRTSS